MRISRLSTCVALAYGALVAPFAGAVPFTAQLTIPDAHGWLRAAVAGDPSIPYTAPQVVIRITGDTANVLARTESGTRYEASSVRIEIPGVGAGVATGKSHALYVGDGTVSLLTPAYGTVFNGGATMRDSALEGYSLQNSIGPIPVAYAATFQWGPQSGMIAFTTDAGVEGSVSAGGSTGSLQVTAGGTAPNPVASTHYTDLGAFLLATGPNGVATFEEGTSSASGGVSFPENLLQVVSSMAVLHFPAYVDEPHSYWFGTSGSPMRFATNDGGSFNPGTTRFEAVFPEDTLATGFFFNCHRCSLTPLSYGIVWTTRDIKGDVVETRTAMVSLAPAQAASQPAPGFFGFTTTRAFRSVTIEKHSPFSEAQPWMIDDLRYATKLASTPVTLVEYRHAGFDHYFITASADEIAKLDNGTFAGWSRTGLDFSAAALGAPGTLPVCRFFSTAFGEKSSHFFTPDATECALVKANANWQYEGNVFGVTAPSALGDCASGTRPLYRLYNGGKGGAPNHRYTTSPGVRQATADAGWIPEGTGVLGVIACVPN